METIKKNEVREEWDEFMTHILGEICNYAVRNDMGPTETLKIIIENIGTILEIDTFDGWEGKNDC